jgi:uncharacterized protein with HEPN domain
MFIVDRKTVRAVELDIIVIGGAVRGIPEEILSRFPEIPWALMRGRRNRIVHAYQSVDEILLWETIQADLPPLKNKLLDLLIDTE